MSFKATAGENFNKVHKKAEETALHCAVIMKESEAEYERYIIASQEIIEKIAKRNDEGEILLDEEDCYIFEGEKPDLSELEEKFGPTIKKYKASQKKLEKYLSGKVTIHLSKFPLKLVPANITGSYLNAIKGMLDG